jgi:hypothetical protein
VRLTSSEWRRIGVLAAISLLVVAIVVFRGGGGSDNAAAPDAEAPTAAAGPSAADQVTEAQAAGAAAVDGVDVSPTNAESAIPNSGDKTFTGALTGPVVYGTPSPENEVQFSVAVEDGIGVDATELASIVDQVLSDPRSWAASSEYGLVRVPTGGLFQLVVTSPETTDEVCAPLQTIGQLSCAIDGVVAINLERWLTGSRGWTETLDDYRAWVINHEIGHQLGEAHRRCPGEGELAPVMQQQSIDLDGCMANPWPYPDGPPPAPAGPVEPTGDGADDSTDSGEVVSEPG